MSASPSLGTNSIPPFDDFLLGIPEPDPYSAIPQELKNAPNWVVWRYEDREGKRTKVPYDPTTGAHARANDPTTWTSFDRAVEAMISGSYDGIGFEFSGTSYCGIDCDHLVHDGIADPFVHEIIRLAGNPYCEISPSGNGLHAFVKCPTLPKGKRKFGTKNFAAEIYSGSEGGRYFTTTGRRFSGSGTTVPTIEDIGLVYLLVSQIADEKFKRLWLGDVSAYGNDDSKADFALLCMLARLTACDAKKMEAYFSQSWLAQRDKWTERDDYREQSIKNAIAEVRKDPNSNQEATKTAILGTADQIVPKRIKWLWKHRFAQKLNLIVGNPDNGKGLVAYYTVACVTKGLDFFDEKNLNPPSEVIVLAGEEDWDDTVVPRLMAAGADLSKVHPLTISETYGDKTTVRELDLSQDAAVLDKTLEDNPNIRLVIIDPVSNYLGNQKMIDEQAIRRVLMPLKEIANRRGVSIIGIMHLNKKVELDAIHRIGGAMAFVGVARMVWLCAPKPAEDGTDSEESLFVKVKGNIVQRNLKGLSFKVGVRYLPIEGEDESVPYVEWTGGVDQQAGDLMTSKHPNPAHRPADQLAECAKWLSETLKDGAVELGDLESDGKALHGFSAATIDRARKAMGIVTFEMGKRKAKDGKQRRFFGCRLPAPCNTNSSDIEVTGVF